MAEGYIVVATRLYALVEVEKVGYANSASVS